MRVGGRKCIEWYSYPLVTLISMHSSCLAGVGGVDSHQMNHNFALAPAIGVGACSIKQPAKKSATPSKSSRLVTLDTSTSCQYFSCSVNDSVSIAYIDLVSR